MNVKAKRIKKKIFYISTVHLLRVPLRKQFVIVNHHRLGVRERGGGGGVRQKRNKRGSETEKGRREGG